MRGSLRSVGPLIVAGLVVAPGVLVAAPAAQAVNPSCDALSITTPGSSSCDVPAGVTQLTVVATGAGGGGAASSYTYAAGNGRGGHGAIVTYILTVTPGETLTLEVGSGGTSTGTNNAGGGGGWTAVKRGATLLVVAGGGGGSGLVTTVGTPTDDESNGGDGAAAGTADGGAGSAPAGGGGAGTLVAAGGGTTSAGGSAGTPGNYYAGYNGTAGSSGVGGGGGTWSGSAGGGSAGGNERSGGSAGGGNGTGGGGGAGYFGGGGGGLKGYDNYGGGGGAGSSYPASGATYATASNGGAAGSDGGDGSITLAAYTPPPTPPDPGGGGSSTPTTVTISLSTNGGTGTAPALSGDQGTWVTVPSGAGLSRPGFAFAGWNTAADGSGTSYAPGVSLQLNGDNTLYAQWQADGSASTGGGSASDTSGGALSPVPATVPPGGSQLLVDGTSMPVTVAPNRAAVRQATGLVIEGDGFTMSLAGRGDASDPLGLTPKQALVLQSLPIQDARARGVLRGKAQPVAESSGTGFLADSQVRLYLLADTYLGSIDTDGSGSYKGSVRIPDGITPGDYVLQVNGFAPGGQVRNLSIGVVVEAQKTAASTKSAKASVYFASMSPTLTDTGKATLKKVVRKTGKDVVKVVSIGFVQPTSSTGNDQSLSTARAKNVAAYLKSLGVKGQYVVRGDGRAKQTGATARRVEVTITYPVK